jgi:hypothetical protein
MGTKDPHHCELKLQGRRKSNISELKPKDKIRSSKPRKPNPKRRGIVDNYDSQKIERRSKPIIIAVIPPVLTDKRAVSEID